MVGFLCSCIVFTPVFLHSFLLHKTILYYFLVFLFTSSYFVAGHPLTFTYTLLAVTSHILLIIIYLTLFFLFTSAIFYHYYRSSRSRSHFFSLSRIVILSSALNIYLFFIYSLVVFCCIPSYLSFFLVCFWL